MTAGLPRPWRSGFCTTDDAYPWQHAACDRTGAGFSRTPTKADPRDWVPCACECHRPPEEPAMPDPTVTVEINPVRDGYALRDSDGQLTPIDDAEPILSLPTAVELVALTAERLSVAAAGTIDHLGWEDAVRYLDELRTAVETIKQVDSLLVRRAYLAGPHGVNSAVLDGIGPVTITRSKNRKRWDERGVARAVIDARMADTTGESPDPWDVAEWLLEVIAVGYCRVTPLRGLGLEPAAFCDEEPGSISVQLPKRS